MKRICGRISRSFGCHPSGSCEAWRITSRRDKIECSRWVWRVSSTTQWSEIFYLTSQPVWWNFIRKLLRKLVDFAFLFLFFQLSTNFPTFPLELFVVEKFEFDFRVQSTRANRLLWRGWWQVLTNICNLSLSERRKKNQFWLCVRVVKVQRRG